MFGAVVSACSPAPRRALTLEEKTADLQWLYSQFNENYAPMQLKERLYGFRFEDLKATTLTTAAATRSNEEFYQVLYSFVAKFKDAHTSGTLMDSSLPERTQVAYLGFNGKRKGLSLLVTELLPTIKKDSLFPVKVGDLILSMDGVLLPEIVRTQMAEIRDMGQDESNLTYHMNRLFSRASTAGKMPTGTDAIIKVNRGGVELEFTLPWITKDLQTFAREQAAAKKAEAEALALQQGQPTPPQAVRDAAQEGAASDASVFDLAAQILAGGDLEKLIKILKQTLRAPGFNYLKTFIFVDTLPTWDSANVSSILRQATGNPLQAAEDPTAVQNARTIPAGAMFLQEAKAFPTYVKLERQLDAAGVATGKNKLIAYMYLNTFSPSEEEDKVVAQVAASLKTLQANGVKDIVIDMINNGGGSLVLGMRLAQLFSATKVRMPDLQFKVSDSWLDSFESDSMNASSDAEREIARRVYVGLKEDAALNLNISRRWNGESLSPFQFVPNRDVTTKLNVVLLVNEMCASMCDIFAAIMRDNGLAKVVGSKTMGAGGNVVTHFQSPNAHFIVNQTESLVVRTGAADGRYVENGGIEPDTEVKVNESISEKYEPVRKKAVDLILAE